MRRQSTLAILGWVSVLAWLGSPDAWAAESCPEGPSDGAALHRKGRRCISPWIIYRGAGTLEALKQHADIIASVSVCGDAPAEFIEAIHKLDIRAYKLVGGKATTYDTAEHRKATIRHYLHLCNELGYDGIDLDHEGHDASYRDAYSALMRETRAALRPRGKKLSMCVSYIMSTRHTTERTHLPDFYDAKVVGETCDVVRVMCYDQYSLSGKGYGPVSSFPWARDAITYWLRFVPPERLIMGLPAYSGDFEMVAGGKRTRAYSAPRPDVPEGVKVARVWLPYEQVNMYTYTDKKGVFHLYYASDVESTRPHLTTAERLGVFGIGFWHYQAVTPAMWKVVRAWHAKGPREAGAYPWLVIP